MLASVYYGPHDVRVENVADPQIQEPTDVVVKITHAAICGSDLWFYRGITRPEPGTHTGHELMGIVEEVGREVRSIKKGDRVIAPFFISDGTCDFCRAGLYTSCRHRQSWGIGGNDAGQGEAARVPLADGTLVVVPAEVGDDQQLLKSLLPLTDVMGTGHHCAVCAGVKEGSTVAIIGDGAVGLCGVLAARRLGAARIILFSHHEDRAAIGRAFGATDIVTEQGEEAVNKIMAMSDGGIPHVMECVGSQATFDTAINIARPGGTVGFVGVPAEQPTIGLSRMFGSNIAMRGGVAPVRAYIPELMADILAGKIDPAPVLTMTVNMSGIPDGYSAMDRRTAIKVMVRPLQRAAINTKSGQSGK